MVTINLGAIETAAYFGAKRVALKAEALRMARARGKRFAQIVGVNGKILDIVEA